MRLSVHTRIHVHVCSCLPAYVLTGSRMPAYLFKVYFLAPYLDVQYSYTQEASSIEIPNIGWDVFHCMMTYIYTGNVEVSPEIAPQLLQASDQYLLEGLKRLCEMRIAQVGCKLLCSIVLSIRRLRKMIKG